MNENEPTNLDSTLARDRQASEGGTSAEVEPKYSFPHREFRLALYSLVAIAFLGNVAARAAPEWMGAAADFVQNRVLLGAANPTQECSGCAGECGKTTFIFEGTSGLPCSGNTSCSVHDCEAESCFAEEVSGEEQVIAIESDNIDETRP
ncbi:hypothetical protein [Novipirellula rosea]|uniref:Uncharacterized protein n=1 Tax=Novipirellula rosea TaxID=1031540 RepID=A0ABP8MJU9_9BACT